MKKSKLILPSVLALALLAGCGGGGSKESSSTTPSSSNEEVSSLVSSLTPESSSSKEEASSSSKESSSSVTPSSSSSSEKPSSSSSVEPVKQDGTAQYPWLISTKEDLETYFLAENDKVNADSYYSLTNDIDFAGEWKCSYITKPFAGVLQGNNHTIKGLKITQGYTSKQTYSLFANADDAHFYNLNLEYSIDLFLSGKGKTFLVGGIAAISNNTTFVNCNVTYKQFDLSLSTNGDSTIYVGGLTPYWTATKDENQTAVYYYETSNSSVSGNIIVDASESSDTAVITGGLVGALYNSYYEVGGIFGINNCKYEATTLRGSNAVGGICGVLMSYASIVNSYVKASTIEAVNASPSYVGGILGQGNYFQSLVGNYVNVNTINGTQGTNTYKSYAGDIVGYKSTSERAYGYEGTLDYNNYAKGAVIDVAEVQRASENKAAYSAALLKDTLKFNENVWDLTGNSPAIKTNPAVKNITIDVNTNGGEGNFSQIKATAGDLNNAVANLSYNYKDKLQTRENYSPKGLFYDAECKYEFRWYTPFNASATLYVGWADLTQILGTYSIQFAYYDSYRNAGNLVVTNQYVYWLMSDGAYSQYEFEFDGENIYLGDFQNPLDPNADARMYKSFGQSFGGYSGEALTLNDDGTLSWYDTQTDDGVYTATKTSSTPSAIPSLKDSPVLGKWYTDTGKNTLDVFIAENSAIVANYNNDTAQVHYFGGLKVNGGKYTFGVGERGLTSDTYSYDATNNLLIGAKFVLARDKVTAVYGTSDASLRIVVTTAKTIIVKDSKVSNGTITGELKDGQIVTIDGTKYKISGKTLTVYEEISPLVGTYTGKATRGTNVLTASMQIKNDKTGILILGDTTLNFVWSFVDTTNKLTITLKSGTNVGDWDLDEPFTLTYDAANQKFTGTLTQDYGSYEFLLEVAIGGLGDVEPEQPEEPVDTGVVGVYHGSMSSRAYTFAISMEVKADGTLTIYWGSVKLKYTYTYNENTKKISATMVGQEGTDGTYDEESYIFTYNDGTITGPVSQDYGDISYTFTVSK